MDAQAARALYEALKARKNGILAPIELDDANLAGLTIVGGDFVQGRFRGANLAYATLPGSRFGKADLEEASFVGADLAGSDFTSAHLNGANLEDATVEGCILSGADLRGARLANWLGTPLSLAGARLDQATLDRSELSNEGLRLLFELGAKLESDGARLPSVPSLSRLSVPPHVEILSTSEVSIRETLVNQDIEEQPASLRTYLQIGALLARGRADELPPPSLRPRLPTLDAQELGGYERPKVGDEYLGISLREEVGLGSVARSFRGVDRDGVEVFVRVFESTGYGASLHYPAFRRGLKSLNELQGQGIAELRVVAVDKTAYAVRYYEGGNLHDVVQTKLSLDAGLTLFEDLTKVVLRVHGEGRLVRSIKPTNVVLDGLEPIITELDSVDLPTLAQSGGSVGGYGAYAAPEEVVGSGIHSPTADVFALGKLLEFILTGTEPLESLGGVSALSLRRDLPPALRQLVERATRPDPVDRYQFVDELLTDLQAIAAHDDATLSMHQSVRPSVPSRLDPKPLAPGAPRAAAKAGPRTPRTSGEKRRQKPSTLPHDHWLPRRVEVGVALVAAFGSLAILTTLILRPSEYDAFQSRALYGAFPLGLAAWLLPRPENKLVLLRITMGVALGCLMATLLPDQLARAAYQRALRHSNPAGKQLALVQLARLGARSFVNEDLRGTRYFKEDLANADFQRADLADADFSGSVLLEVDFSGANLNNTVFNGSDLREARFEGALALETSGCDQLTLLSPPFACLNGHIAAGD